MRYSSIVGLGFYGIKLTTEQYEVVDAHFVACAHHLRRYEQSKSKFHQKHFWHHLRALMVLVKSGNFVESMDLSEQNMNIPENWTPLFQDHDNPSQSAFYPDPDMFCMMVSPDERYLTEQIFPYDLLLTENISPSKISLEKTI